MLFGITSGEKSLVVKILSCELQNVDQSDFEFLRIF